MNEDTQNKKTKQPTNQKKSQAKEQSFSVHK